ncbi:MAG: hypothetical protein PHH14_05645 [Candidatus Margulisbacteria bacterium]|nr:hypothetical protein [Candidatus Margulisiibacteriota bacterium]
MGIKIEKTQANTNLLGLKPALKKESGEFLLKLAEQFNQGLSKCQEIAPGIYTPIQSSQTLASLKIENIQV